MTTKTGPIWVVAMQNGWYGPTPATHRFITEGEKFQIKSMDEFSNFDRNEMVKDGKGVEYKRPPGWMRLVTERRELEKAEDGLGVNKVPDAAGIEPVLETAPAEPAAPVDEVPRTKAVRRGGRKAGIEQ